MNNVVTELNGVNENGEIEHNLKQGSHWKKREIKLNTKKKKRIKLNKLDQNRNQNSI